MKSTAATSRNHPALKPVAIGLAGIAALTASSWVSVPMYPVPVTMQTLVVLLLGALCGPRGGFAIVMAWLALSLTGAPVLAGGKSGLVAFAGPTAGYLAAFPVAAFLAGLLPRSEELSAHAVRFGGFLALHVLILTAGSGWLSTFIGAEAAIMSGVMPFLIGALLKSALGAALIAGFQQTTR